VSGENPVVYSVSEILQIVRSLLEAKFPNVLIQGEITNFKIASSGHMYFSLKDERGLLGCVFFKGNSGALAFQPEDGLQVVVGGTLTLYEAQGRFQMNVRIMEPKGVGGLQLAFEQLKKKLAEEGLFSPERKRALPKFPRRIAVVTSMSGAAIRDFLKILKTRVGVEDFEIFDVKVQGREAPDEIKRAIEEVSRRKEHDVLVLTRGGGSQEDLSAFNDEFVVRALAQCPIPTVSAVGHEIDFTLCDFVADVRAATPTQAAALIAPGRDEIEAELRNLALRLKTALTSQLDDKKRDLKEQAHALQARRPDLLLDQARQDLDEQSESLQEALTNLWKDRQLQLQRMADFLARANPLQQLKPYVERVRGLEAQLAAYHPYAPLKRGYSVVTRTKTGEILKSSKGVKKGEKLGIRLWQGSLESEVTRSDS
jgi:exodeoxyribonuclease VII large subunit